MTDSTRHQFLQTARRLFASKGFYGTSLANIADELGLTKQALLHHFGNKEKLYAEILRDISDAMLRTVSVAVAAYSDPGSQLEAAFANMYALSAKHPEDTQILIRELLDVERRKKDVHSWYLRPFLEALVDIVMRIPTREQISRQRAITLIYPLLGAMNYLIASEIVLQEIYGPATYNYMKSQFPDQLKKQVIGLIGDLG